eukprot:TRINITY_DN1435_c0_g1_i1.p1 TRINITY_DN1435_c0_g1~~TRINITY_DN1435_c0_g1_i1.p1  ORF type:complete len:227 (+),score=58.91 TRINITY_DN1435_c0_g1_i1:619-1299(+)
MEEIELPVEKVDIIISEWMGYFLLYESMLDTVLFARDRYLRPGGLILPSKVSLYLAAIEDFQYKRSKLVFWDNIYGVNMECMKRAAISEPLIDCVSPDQIVSRESKILELNLYTVTPPELDFSHKYSMKIERSDRVHGLVAWFEAEFTGLKEPIKLTTSPYNKGTHWRQTIFYLGEEINANAENVLHGSIAVRKSLKDHRSLDIKISYHYSDHEFATDFVQQYKLQ